MNKETRLLTFSRDMVRLDEGASCDWRPPLWYDWGLPIVLFPQPILIWECRLLFWTNTLDPRFGDLLVGQLKKILNTVL